MKDEVLIEITFDDIKQTEKDIVVAILTGIGFEGFEESDDSLKAYVTKVDYKEDELKNIAGSYSLSYQLSEIQPQNWNALWESHFDPVIINDFVAIRAHFHEPVQGVRHEIVITPKMSFGTGHHATTTMMVQQMQDISFSGKKVFDFGTGTGILAILAEKLGAAEVLAVDNDEWSIENSKENAERNHCRNIDIRLTSSAGVPGSFDVILANINRNVILDNFTALNERLQEKGYLLLSGLLAGDEHIIIEAAGLYPLQHLNTRQSGQWISLLFCR